MNKLLRLVILIASVTISAITVGIAYFSNYSSVLEQPNTLMILILILLFVNITANIFQIIDFLERHLTQKKKTKEEKFYKATRNLEITYYNPFQTAEQETTDTQQQ